MKKLFSFFIAITIAISSVITGFAVYADEKNESKEINNFIDGVVELTQEYDKEKEFVAPEENETAQIQPFSAQNSEEVTDNNEPEYTLQDFQTARLIVRADGKFDDFDALEHVSGFEDYHILQYDSPEAAMTAYYELQSEKNIIGIEPDLIVKMISDEPTEPTKTAVTPESSEHLTPWSLQRTQADRLLNYLETSDIKMEEVTVAVIDSGLDYNHEFLKDRVDRTEFNSSPDGKPDDEMDVEISHGTSVASVVVDNTPDNVRIKGYKALGDGYYGSTAGATTAILKAITDEVDVINLSINFIEDKILSVAALEKAIAANITVVCAVGNSGLIQTIYAPANIEGCITAGATDKNNIMTDFSDKSWNVDVSAPGQEIMTAKTNNQYELSDGTSFSSPCVASLAAIISSIYPNLTNKQIEKIIKNSTIPVKNIYNYVSHLDGTGMVQFCNALNLPKLDAVETNLTEYKYDDPPTCVLSCADKNAKILFTGNGSYPDISTAMEYTEPFIIDEFARIRAVAYYPNTGYYSDEIDFTVRVRTLGDEKDFLIDKNGVVTKYTGNDVDLIIPDTINGITVTGIEKGAFDKSEIYGLTLPKTITEISQETFKAHKTLSYIEGEGILNIRQSALEDVQSLLEVDFPNLIMIDWYAFRKTYNLGSVCFEKLERIEGYAFDDSGVYEFYGPSVTVVNAGAFNECDFLEILYLPNWEATETGTGGKTNALFFNTAVLNVANFPNIKNLKKSTFRYSGVEKVYLPSVTEIDTLAFNNCPSLKVVSMPNLTEIPRACFSDSANNILIHTTYIFDNVVMIQKNAFENSYANRLEFSRLESTKSLPLVLENGRYPFCIIAMPSTFKECTEDTKGRNYKVYGTKGTEAEKWANENEHEFIEISQNTAVLTPLPEKYTDADGVLTADVIGFNRTYQWYGSFTADNTAGTPIDGATNKDFNPAEYPAYPYYYCVVTSTDVGYDPIEIRTNVTENTTYQSADYTEYNKAVEQANALNRDNYVDLSKLDEALSIDVSNLSVKDQALVDAQTDAIINAINSLVYKSADYTEYNKAIEQAKSLNRDDYVDFSKVDEALAVDVSGKNITEQDIVDKQTKAILEAIDSLTEKEKPTEPPVTEPEEPTKPNQPELSVPEETTKPDTSVDADTPSIPNTGTNESISCAAASLLLLSLCAYFISRKKKNQE